MLVVQILKDDVGRFKTSAVTYVFASSIFPKSRVWSKYNLSIYYPIPNFFETRKV